MKRAFYIPILALSLAALFYSCLSTGGLSDSVEAEGGKTQASAPKSESPAAPKAETNLIFPLDREAFKEAYSWRTNVPDPDMVQLKKSSVDQLRRKDVDRYVKEVVKSISSKSLDDFHKVKMINDIIALTLSYDAKSFFSSSVPPQTYQSVLQSGLGVCEGFSAVFQKFCNEAGIKCRTVHGYARGAGTSLENESLSSIRSNHAWNIVTIKGREYLVDSTWNEGHLDGSKSVKEYNTQWLFAYPEAFVYTHFPDKKEDQLLGKALSKEDFASLPALRPAFFDIFGSLRGKMTSITSCPGSLNYEAKLIDPAVKFSATVYGSGCENAFFFKNGGSGSASLMFAFPNAGSYRISFFDMSGKKSLWLGEFCVRASDKSSVKFPLTYSNYGPAEGGTLESPIEGPLSKGKDLYFKVLTKKSSAAVLIREGGNTKWNYLKESSRGVFEGTVTIPLSASKLSVSVKDDKNNSYWTIADFALQ